MLDTMVEDMKIVRQMIQISGDLKHEIKIFFSVAEICHA